MCKCLWDSHNVRTVGDLVQIKTYNKNPDHNKNSKKCKCMKCSTTQIMGCSHPNLCFKESALILTDISNNEITMSDKLTTEVNAISPPTDVKIFNPKVMSSANIHNHLCIFTNPKRTSPTPVWHPPFPETPQDTIVFTDGSCTLNGDTRAATGLGVWFSKDDLRNSAAPIGKNITQTNNSGELLAIYHTLQLTPSTNHLHIKTDSKWVNVNSLCDNLESSTSLNFINVTHANLLHPIINTLHKRVGCMTFEWIKGHTL